MLATTTPAKLELWIRTMLECANDTVTITSEDGLVLEANHRWRTLLGIEPSEMIGKPLVEFVATPGDDLVVPLRHATTGKTVFMEFSTTVIDFDDERQAISIGRDISEKIEADLRAAGSEAVRRRLDERLAHAQKLDALGRLTGGIAHDFNNVLAVILGNADFLIGELAEADPRRADAEAIRVAGHRAAALTRKLLAFSRHQMLELAPVDVSTMVTNLAKMLRPMIGEDIELEITGSTEGGTVSADVSQLEHVLVNLVVNARDAMPKGGRLTISTTNVDLEPGAEIPAGSYVLLAVSDSGCGMDAETKRHMFDPFFTTKDRGKGTGLGLSTSYGIVTQCGGHLWAYSEPGEGTVIKVFLPRIDQAPAPVALGVPAVELHGTETVLLVEDDRAVREALRRVLVSYGYDVLVANGADEALEMVRAHVRPIELIVSDVVMPGASGPAMAAQLQKDDPRVRVLLMSGFTDHALLHQGLHLGARFLQKPFAPEHLARRARELLDSHTT